MMLARPQLQGWGQPQLMQQPMQPQMGFAPQMPQVQLGMQPGMGQLPPELLARLQQMHGGLGGYGQMQNPQMGLGRPGIQPLAPSSAYSLR